MARFNAAALAVCALAACAQHIAAESIATPPRFSVKGRVESPPDLENEKEFFLHTRVVLDGDAHVAHLAADGTFTFNDLPSASYTMEVYTPNYTYMSLRVDVSSKFQDDVRVVKSDLVNGAMPVKIFYSPQSGLLLKPIKINQYFIVKQGWSIWGIVRNPMFMMMGMPLIMMYVMPKMMEGMDKEQLAEMQKQQSSMQGGGSGINLAESLASMTSGGAKASSKKK